MTVWRLLRPLIVATAGAGGLWISAAGAATLADPTPSRPGAVREDPTLAARQVFQEQEFWWKRIEPRKVSTSWIWTILRPVGELVSFILKKLVDVWDWILRFLSRLFGALTGQTSGGSGRTLIWLIVVTLLAWSLWKLYPVIVRWLGQKTMRFEPQDGVESRILAEATTLLQQATQAFRDGQYAEAIRLALLALIARLEKQGLLRYDPTRTNGEYYLELRHATELAASFNQLARIYERVWYGRLTAERDEAERAVSLCGSLINGEGMSPG